MTPVTHRGRRRLDPEQPTERLRGLLDDDLRETGHDLPDETSELAADPDEQAWVSPIRARVPWATLVIAGLVLVTVVLAIVLRGGPTEQIAAAESAAESAGESSAGESSAGASVGVPQEAAAQGTGVSVSGPSGAAVTGASEGSAGAATAGGASAAGSPAAGAPGSAGAPVTVHVVGEVAEPGVVEVPAGSRVADAVEAAGGLRDSAVVDAVNMAAPAVDGAQIVIPDRELSEQWEQSGQGSGPAGAPAGAAASAAAGSGAAASGGAEAGAEPPSSNGASGAQEPGGSSGLIDLNQATAAQLEELPRVGPVLAQRIIDHRDQLGGFRSVEELDDVSGIGPAMMEAVAPLVSV